MDTNNLGNFVLWMCGSLHFWEIIYGDTQSVPNLWSVPEVLCAHLLEILKLQGMLWPISMPFLCCINITSFRLALIQSTSSRVLITVDSCSWHIAWRMSYRGLCYSHERMIDFLSQHQPSNRSTLLLKYFKLFILLPA